MQGDARGESPNLADETNACVLVVDGQPEDRQLICRLLAQFPLSLSLISVSSAAEAMAHLVKAEQHAARAPDLVLLDFDLPDLSAPRLLAQLRRHSHFKALPVVALTRSSEPDVIRRAYDFGANAVINRTGPPEVMDEIVRTLMDFWFRVADRYLID